MVFLKIYKKAPVPDSFFNKVPGLKPANLLKKRLWHRWFPLNFAKILRRPISWNTSGGCFYFLFCRPVKMTYKHAIYILKMPINNV